MVAIAVAAGFAVGSFATTGASTPAPSVSAITVSAGDSYRMVAARLAPGATTAQRDTLAHALARRNGGTDATSITSGLNADNILFYLPADIPAGAATTTTTAPTSTPPVTTAPNTTAPSTTPAPTTTTTTPATSPPPTTPSVAGCGLASAAFCETFDAPHNGGTQTGDLDPTLWGVSRIDDFNPGNVLNGWVTSHNACSGGGTTDNASPTNDGADGNSRTFGPATPAPGDARVCNGQYVSSNNDGGAVSNIDAYPKQPFNFAGRTGKVVFDVSADSDGGHAAWPEFLITDKPVPGVHRCISQCELGEHATPTAKNQVGFSIADANQGFPGHTGIDTFFVSVNGVYANVPNELQGTSISKGSSTSMNHVEVNVSKSRIDVYATDAGSKVLKHIGGANIALGFEQGLVWLNDVHYNARKSVEPGELGIQYDHSFAWDNLGFDGPKTYRDWAYDVPLNRAATCCSQGGEALTNLGYQTGGNTTLTVSGVKTGKATAAQVVLNSYSFATTTIDVSVNGHTPVSFTHADGYSVDAISVPIPLSDVVSGTNTIRFTSTSGSTTVANVSLVMVAAASVP
ncbi:MAG: hypothetical protein ABIR68_13500 [Ilumatobacteraceae bacterium]